MRFFRVIRLVAAVYGASSPVRAESVEPAAKAINHVAASLGKQVLTGSGNPVFSPWSLQTVLAMAWTGAGGETEAEMKTALGLNGEREAVSGSFSLLRKTLTLPRPKETPAAVYAASRLFVDQSYSLETPWTDLLKSAYGAGADTVPFKERSQEAFSRINGWVKESTAGRITGLFPDSGSSSLTRLVLADAVYLNVPWERPFEKRFTRLETFFVARGNARQASFMNTEQQLCYARKAGFQIVALPYAARDLQFVAMIPDKGDGLAGIVAGLTPALLSGCTKMPTRLVSLALPRLELKPPSINLVEPLRAIGLTKAANPLLADFSGISKSQPRLFISCVRQSAWFLLDEHGTKAAAATDLSAEPFGEAPSPPKPIVLRADRPFLFMIQHVPSGACLFMGCVTDPGAAGSMAGR